MARPREHIDAGTLLHPVAELGEAPEIARERAGIAGDVYDPLGPHPGDRADHAVLQPLARGIDHDDLRGDAAPPEFLRGLGGVGAGFSDIAFSNVS